MTDEINYDFADLDEIVLAYAISVHKSQGSEYPAVIIPVLDPALHPSPEESALYRYYEGKKLVILVGTKKALAIAIRNNKPQTRYTHLAERLRV